MDRLKKSKKGLFRDYVMVTIGTVILTIGVYIFKIPNKFIMGGVTGISVALSSVMPDDFFISTAWIIMILNVLLLAVGFVFVGKSFGLKTVYASLLSSGLGIVIDYMNIGLPLTDNLLLETCFSVILPGAGTAIMFYYGASSGGTDIIAMILKKYTHMESGKALMCVDVLIMIVSFTNGVEIGLLSTLGLLAKSLVIDRLIEKMNNSKYFLIITTKPHEIGIMINDEFGRGATMWKGQGMYTHTEKYIILVVMSPREAVHIRDEIKKIDSHAFIIVENSSDIMGKGFRAMY